MAKRATKTVEMGAAQKVEIVGCAVIVDGEEVDSWSAKTSTARAGWAVWSLSAEQVQLLLADVGAGFSREDHPMRGFHS